jgi:lipocalin
MLPRFLGLLVSLAPLAGATRLSLRGDTCKERYLLVEYREHPAQEVAQAPVRGSFYYKSGEWAQRPLMRKRLANNGCSKSYEAVCAHGKGGLKVTRSCPGQIWGDEERRSLPGHFNSARRTRVGKGEELVLTLPSGEEVRLTSGEVKLTAVSAGKCPIVETQQGFDLMAYVSKPWYVQQQMVTRYLPVTWNYCVEAKYTVMEKSSFWGYTINVRNIAREADGTLHDSGSLLRAYNADKYDPAKLAVAPSFLPKALAGDYWVLAYSEEEGYALISGGQPTITTDSGCKTESGTNEAGLWIFTRARKRDDALVRKVRDIAASKGFDLSVLNDVDQSLAQCEDLRNAMV